MLMLATENVLLWPDITSGGNLFKIFFGLFFYCFSVVT